MGFGNLERNFWLGSTHPSRKILNAENSVTHRPMFFEGLDKIRKIVTGKTCQLRMHVETFGGQNGHANYRFDIQ